MRKKSVFLRLWSYLTRYKATLFLAIFLKVLSSFMSVLGPFYFRVGDNRVDC